MTYKKETRDEALRLRIRERRSLKDIARKLKVAKSTLSLWLRNFPLSEEERRCRSKEATKIYNDTHTHKHITYEEKIHKSRAYNLVLKYGGLEMNTLRKARISESAVIYRLNLIGCNTYSSIFDGDKFDLLVAPPNKEIIKIQVRWAAIPKRYGSPVIRLRKSAGRKNQAKYEKGDFDFIIGYILKPDYCYVYAWDEVAEMNTKTITKDALEKWEKILRFKEGR